MAAAAEQAQHPEENQPPARFSGPGMNADRILCHAMHDASTDEAAEQIHA